MKKEEFDAICDGTYFKINKEYLLSDSDIDYIVNEIKQARYFFENQLNLLPNIKVSQIFHFGEASEVWIGLRFNHSTSSKIFFRIWIKIDSHKIEKFEFELEDFKNSIGTDIIARANLEEFKKEVITWLET